LIEHGSTRYQARLGQLRWIPFAFLSMPAHPRYFFGFVIRVGNLLIGYPVD